MAIISASDSGDGEIWAPTFTVIQTETVPRIFSNGVDITAEMASISSSKSAEYVTSCTAFFVETWF